MKGVIRGLKNELYQYDEGERLVRELTANDSTPPSTQNLIKLKLLLGKSFQFQTIVRMLFKRLRDFDNLRHVEKSLIVIEYLLKNAERKFVRYCQMEIKTISKLQRYRYMLNGHDYGQLIRKRAKRITNYLQDDDKLKEARAKAQGYAMSYKYGNNGSNTGNNTSNTKPKYSPYSDSRSSRPYSKQKPITFDDDNNTSSIKDKNLSPSKAKLMKDKKKKKKPAKKSKKKVDPDLNKPMANDDDLFAAFVGASNGNNNKFIAAPNNKFNSVNDNDFGDVNNDSFFDNIGSDDNNGNNVDDLLSSNFWENENEQGNDNEFDWFKPNDNELNIDKGTGDDGGEFGFGKDDDFFDDNADTKDNYDDADQDEISSLMTNIANLDNVLQAKPNQKKQLKKKGKTMAQMAGSNIPTSFDPNFIENSFKKQPPQQTDLFGNPIKTNNNINNGMNSSNIFGNTNQGFYGNQPQRQIPAQQQPNQGYGFQQFYQPKNAQNNMYGSSGPIPATIPPKNYNKQDNDPFAQFGFK